MGSKREWLTMHGITGAAAEAISGLEADLDRTKPLYYWQLYSILGHEPIVEIVRSFYERVYADKAAPWFRDAFTRISGIDHHVATQAAFWVDAFGGGRKYHGSSFRINFHHHHNAPEVMNAAGAARWMLHMRGALNAYDFSKHDPRVKPCIVDFLKTKMKRYAHEHKWTFDEADFEPLERTLDKPPAYPVSEMSEMTLGGASETGA